MHEEHPRLIPISPDQSESPTGTDPAGTYFLVPYPIKHPQATDKGGLEQVAT